MEDMHECKTLADSNVNITIRKHNNDWLWIFWDDKEGNTSHGIKYCPYCGEELN